MLHQWPFQPVHSPFAFAPCGFTSARLALPITKPLFLPARSKVVKRHKVRARLGLAHSQSLSVGVGWCPDVIRSRS